MIRRLRSRSKSRPVSAHGAEAARLLWAAVFLCFAFTLSLPVFDMSAAAEQMGLASSDGQAGMPGSQEDAALQEKPADMPGENDALQEAALERSEAGSTTQEVVVDGSEDGSAMQEVVVDGPEAGSIAQEVVVDGPEAGSISQELAVGTAESNDVLDHLMQGFLASDEILGASLIVRKDGAVVYKSAWGYSDFAGTRPSSDDDIYRIYSMTKPITAVAVMILSDRGQLSIDDPVSRYLPSFESMHVMTDERFSTTTIPTGDAYAQLKEVFRMAWATGTVALEPAGRQITIRDLLTHSSGLGQGLASTLQSELMPALHGSLREVASGWGETCLDFQPGSRTGYSAIAGFDVLAEIVEIVSGESYTDFVQREIFDTLSMKDTTFVLSDEQRQRLVSIVYRTDAGLADMTGSWESEPDEFQAREGYVSGSGGLFSTLDDYEHFAEMLCNEGSWNGRMILKPETVAQMRTEADVAQLDVLSPEAWGLGLRIRQKPEALSYHTVAGTYGWSGTAGTHFFVCPALHLDCVLMLNRAGIGGNESPVSLAVENAVFDLYDEHPTDISEDEEALAG